MNRVSLVLGKGQLYCSPGWSDSSHLSGGHVATEGHLGRRASVPPNKSLSEARPEEEVNGLLMLLKKRESLELVE